MLLVYWNNKTKNWAMDTTKHEDQIKPVIEQWHFSNSLVNLLGILAPAAFLAILLGHSGTFIEFLFNADYWKIKGPRCTEKKKQSQDIHFSNWLLNFFSTLKFKNDSKCGFDTVSPREIWKDGSILCNIVNMIVPGACKDPRSHRLQTPKHGQKLVHEYFDIKPIFTPLELSQKTLSQTQEKKFSKYLNKIQQILRKENDNITNMKFSTDYVARGMGLVVAQQNKKSTFYIYPVTKRYPNTCDLDISIKGPCGNHGKITIPAISQPTQKCQPSTEYKRSLYMSSKLNSISPTIQGSSFLRKLSLSSEDTRNEMDIKVKLSTTRIKVSYIPENTGIYEISLITRGCHIVGSPYPVPVELATVSNYCANDTDSEEEKENKFTYKNAKVLSRIIDFVDEKMLLKDDGTLEKIDDNFKNTETNKYFVDKNRLKSRSFLDLNNKNTDEKKTSESFESREEENNNLPIKSIETKNEENIRYSNMQGNNKNVSASFTEVNVPQILESKDPTLTSKVQDPQKIPQQDKPIIEKYNNEECLECPTTLKKGLKKMGAIVENPIFDRKNSMVEKQKQYWTEKMNAVNSTEQIKHQKPPKILRSSFFISAESQEETPVDINIPFEGIVENNVKLFEVKLNSSNTSIKKSNSFKIDIPKLNLHETIYVKNIEIVTNNQKDNLIKLPSIEERRSKFLQACNKPLRPKRIRNIICSKIEDNSQKVSSNISNMSEPNVSVRRKYRFKRAKLYFQSLEKINDPEEQIAPEKHLGIISLKVENQQNQNLHKSDSEYQLNSKIEPKISRSESDPCVLQRTPKKISERFQVSGLFKDVLEDSRFIGLANKKAVVASLASLETTCDPLVDLTNKDINEIDYFEKSTKKLDDNVNSIPGYHKDFPHIPNKNSWKRRSRINSDITGLIPGRELLSGNVEI